MLDERDLNFLRLVAGRLAEGDLCQAREPISERITRLRRCGYVRLRRILAGPLGVYLGEGVALTERGQAAISQAEEPAPAGGGE